MDEKLFPIADKIQLNKAELFIRNNVTKIPETVIILGSGLAYFADKMKIIEDIPTDKIPYYPQPTVSGHQGRLVFGKIGDVEVLAAKGRSHFYEGKTLTEITFPLQLFSQLGIKNIILTNAAGGVNSDYYPGDFVLIDDYINFTQIDVMPGYKTEKPFSKKLQDIAKKTAENLNQKLFIGSYCWTTGPSYETAAEVQAIQKIGGDLVGMSTVPELLMASYLNLNILAISLVTNLAAGISKTPLTHEEVKEVAEQIKEPYTNFIKNIVLNI